MRLFGSVSDAFKKTTIKFISFKIMEDIVSYGLVGVQFYQTYLKSVE